MTFETNTTDQLVRIAAAGGGFTLNAGAKTVDQLVRIAAAAVTGGGNITFVGLSGRLTTDQVVRISAAGKGRITFQD